MSNKTEEIRAELIGKTGLAQALEEDLIERIMQIENAEHIIEPMKKADLILGLACAVFLGIVPVLLTGAGVL